MKIPHVFSWEKKGYAISFSVGPVPIIVLSLLTAMLLLRII